MFPNAAEQSSRFPRVNDIEFYIFEIADIAGGQCSTTRNNDACNLHIPERDRATFFSPPCSELRCSFRRGLIER